MKHYHDSDAARLMEAVAQSGGRWLDETCASVEHDFIMPNGDIRTHTTNACEEEALFLVQYDPSQTVMVNEPRLIPDPSPDAPDGRRIAQKDDDGNVLYDVVKREESFEGQVIDRAFVRVCANDDLMREWPRFRHHMRFPDPARS